MTSKRKYKNIMVDLPTYKMMEKIWGPGKVPYNPTIFAPTAEEVKEEDGNRTDTS
jgi:hypothetical protein